MKLALALLLCLSSLAQANIGETYKQSAARYGGRGECDNTVTGLISWGPVLGYYICAKFTDKTEICTAITYVHAAPAYFFDPEINQLLAENLPSGGGDWVSIASDGDRVWRHKASGKIAFLGTTGPGLGIQVLTFNSETSLLTIGLLKAPITQPDLVD